MIVLQSYILMKPTVFPVVSYQGIGCMVQPLLDEAPEKQYQMLGCIPNSKARNRKMEGLRSLNADLGLGLVDMVKIFEYP